MANELDILVNVIAKGQDQLKSIDKDLDKLSTTQTKNTTALTKEVANNNLLTTSLSKQIPVLRSVQPLMAGLGLGWIAGAGAVAALGIGAMQANQAFETWLTGMLSLNVVQNTLAGSTQNYDQLLADTEKNSAKLGISTGAYSKELASIESNIPGISSVTALEILNDAVSISHSTGLPLDQVVTQLSNAFKNGAWKDGAFISPGILALQTMEEQLSSTGNAALGMDRQVQDAWSELSTNISTGAGGWVHDIKISLEKIAVDGAWGLGQLGDVIKTWVGPGGTIPNWFSGLGDNIKNAKIWDNFGNWWHDTWPGVWDKAKSLWADVTGFFSSGGIGSISAAPIFDKIGNWWNNTWPDVWNGIKGKWDTVTGFFKNIDWDSVWANLGSTWSRIWRGAVNLAIISPVNALISLLDMIHFDIPSWVPLLGGKTFGINISPIPMLANGGIATGAGSAIVGENGPELINLPKGASVNPLSNGGSFGPITIPIYIGNELLTQVVIKDFDQIIRLRGGY